MSEFVDDIAAKLVADGFGVIGTTIFISSKAVIPPVQTGSDPVLISLLETGGLGSTRTQNSARSTSRPSMQIVCRAKSYVLAQAKARLIYNALDGLFNVTLSGVYYLSIIARQEPTDTGLDESGRPRVTFNIDAEKAPS